MDGLPSFPAPLDPAALSTPAIAPVGDRHGSARDQGQPATARFRRLPPKEGTAYEETPSGGYQVIAPPSPLLEALDRLRATSGVRRAETEYLLAMRAMKAYAPIVENPPPAADSDTVPNPPSP